MKPLAIALMVALAVIAILANLRPLAEYARMTAALPQDIATVRQLAETRTERIDRAVAESVK